MLVRRRMLATASAVLLAFALASCTPGQPTPTKSASAAATPLFSSDEEALKAATDAYAAYLKMSDTISHDGGANPERIAPYATANAAKLSAKSAAQFRDAGAHSVGATAFQNVTLQRQSDSSVIIYACEDVSGVDIIDSHGTSIVAADRQSRIPVAITTTSTGSRDLVVSDEHTLQIAGICA
ncbi:hypothetical protein ACX9R5_10305 [Rathayibacter sp. CAU 1779]